MVQHAPHQHVCNLNMKIERSYTAQSCPPHTQIDFNFDGEGIKDGGVAKHRCALKLLPWCYTAILNQCNGWFNHTVLSCASKGLFDWWRIGGQIIVANWPSMGAPWSWDWGQSNAAPLFINHANGLFCTSKYFYFDQLRKGADWCVNRLLQTSRLIWNFSKKLSWLNTEPVYEKLAGIASYMLKENNEDYLASGRSRAL